MRFGETSLDGAFPGVTLGWVEHGDPAAEQVVVCVHGLTRNARDFDALGAFLAERGARVIAIDIVGRGRSSWLADPARYAVPVYAAHVAALMKILELPAIDWIGTSMGGLIGMLLAAGDDPPMRRLILNDIGPFVPSAAVSQIGAYLGRDLVFSTIEEVEAYLRTIHAGFAQLDDARWRHLAETSVRRVPAGLRLHYDPAIRLPFEAAADTDIELWSIWDRITLPTFVLRGASSPLLTADTAAAMRERGPRAELATVADAGHAPALRDRTQLLTVADWLGL